MSDGLHKEYGRLGNVMPRSLNDAFGTNNLDTPSGELVRTRANTISFRTKRSIPEPWWMAVLGGAAMGVAFAVALYLAI